MFDDDDEYTSKKKSKYAVFFTTLSEAEAEATPGDEIIFNKEEGAYEIQPPTIHKTIRRETSHIPQEQVFIPLDHIRQNHRQTTQPQSTTDKPLIKILKYQVTLPVWSISCIVVAAILIGRFVL